ncbi:MAG: hypothetical protein EOO80_01675 [Oxalobacteraceae bacterium]|nr:MAG: hypothetical protein EOO80_01675 [Oxalobacteraceae bacterium]
MLDSGRFPALLLQVTKMPNRLASLDALVHPHQMEVQDFASYDLIVDARSPGAFQEDHIPGALNVPVGTADRQVHQDISVFGVVRESALGIPYKLAAAMRPLAAGARVLVYCDRGGLDSLVWADSLRAAGFDVDVLPGGWGNYVRWVAAGLAVLSRSLGFRLLIAPPVSGMSRVVARLRALDQQVIDLTALAGQRLLPGVTLVSDSPPSQAAFETALLDLLRRLDPRRVVWLRVSLCGLGELTLPPALRDALAGSAGTRLEVPLTARAKAWHHCLLSKGSEAARVINAIAASSRPPASDVLESWRQRSGGGQVLEVLAEVITGYIERRQCDEIWGRETETLAVSSEAAESVGAAVDDWCAEVIRRQGDRVPI